MEGDAPDKFPSSLELENRQMELQPGPQGGAMGDTVMANVCTTSIYTGIQRPSLFLSYSPWLPHWTACSFRRVPFTCTCRNGKTTAEIALLPRHSLLNVSLERMRVLTLCNQLRSSLCLSHTSKHPGSTSESTKTSLEPDVLLPLAKSRRFRTSFLKSEPCK